MKKTGSEYILTKKQKGALEGLLNSEWLTEERVDLHCSGNEAGALRDMLSECGIRARDVSGYEVFRELELATRKADAVLIAWYEQCKGGAE